MSENLFKQGGQYNIKKTGRDSYQFQIPLNTDEHGRLARECPNDSCSPGYFKLKPGTGIMGVQSVVYCPYCRHEDEPNSFVTKEQMRYANDIMMREAHQGIERMMKDALGIGSSGKKKIGGGMFSMELSYKPSRPPYVRRPFEEEVLRMVICPNCGLNHAVFGLAIWCPDCGKDIFMTHVNAEYDVVRVMLGDIDRRQKELGHRIAARDMENCLEDTVSIFEAVLKAFYLRYLQGKGETSEKIQLVFENKIKNGFQNPKRAEELIRNRLQLSLFECLTSEQFDFVCEAFEKRHPITHNLGVIDKKYLEKAVAAEKKGREIRVTQEEVLRAIDISFRVLENLHSKLFM